MKRTLLVAGMGRCGTTLAMRMLHAAGVQTVGQAPDWEDYETQRLLEESPEQWADIINGKASKLLDAHRWPLPQLGHFDLLWLARDPKEQAKSMFKLLGSAFALIKPDRGDIRRMARSIIDDTPRALRAINSAGNVRSGIALRFEDIIQRPAAMSQVMCEAFGIDRQHAPAMAAQVVDRNPTCLPYLMEASFA